MKNQITQLSVDYIRPSRTVETYMISDKTNFNVLYVYNYEGWHFRVFNSVLNLIGFFNDKNESDFDFDDEEKLDKCLEELELI